MSNIDSRNFFVIYYYCRKIGGRKMKLNKKGFTLIELLAVIVILAIIALIAVPQILNILNRARKSAAADSAYGILKAAETDAMQYMLDNNGNSIGAITYTCDGTECSYTPTASAGETPKKRVLDFKGTKPTSGGVQLDSQGNATIATSLVINGFTCTQSGDTVTCNNATE
ncbi:MAG: prepilin-type N-terminal cleavage/methylation domain-containing protein [Bacilli bacterium]|nr:prepilin-type N-terminal cleavage/methylation domain-containing protein [Bacilli bacterium]